MQELVVRTPLAAAGPTLRSAQLRERANVLVLALRRGRRRPAAHRARPRLNPDPDAGPRAAREGGRPGRGEGRLRCPQTASAVRAMCSSMGTSSTLPHESESCVCQELRNLDPWSSSLVFSVRSIEDMVRHRRRLEQGRRSRSTRDRWNRRRPQCRDERPWPRSGRGSRMDAWRRAALIVGRHDLVRPLLVDVGDRMRRGPAGSPQGSAPATSAAAPRPRSRAGLSSAEVERRRRTGGRNVLPPPPRTVGPATAPRPSGRTSSPLMLWVAAVLAFVAGMPQLGVAIFVVVVVNGVVRLRPGAPRRAGRRPPARPAAAPGHGACATASRWRSTPPSWCVGDLVLLDAGDRVCADLRARRGARARRRRRRC